MERKANSDQFAQAINNKDLKTKIQKNQGPSVNYEGFGGKGGRGLTRVIIKNKNKIFS